MNIILRAWQASKDRGIPCDISAWVRHQRIIYLLFSPTGSSERRKQISISLLQFAEEQHGWIKTPEKGQTEKSNSIENDLQMQFESN